MVLGQSEEGRGRRMTASSKGWHEQNNIRASSSHHHPKYHREFGGASSSFTTRDIHILTRITFPFCCCCKLNHILKNVSISILLLLSHFSRVRLCVTPETAAHWAPPSLGFSRQEHWSGLPFPSPRHESENWMWSHWVVSNSQRPHGLQPTRLLRPWEFPSKSTGVGCHCLLQV